MVFLCNHNNALFDKKEAERIFKENNNNLNCPLNYDIISQNDWFFSVIDNKGVTIGICYILMDKLDNKKVPFYSGAFDRKKHKEALEAHKLLLELAFKYFKRIYTWTPHLHAHLFNIKAGMTRNEKNRNIFYKDRR